MTSTPRPGDTVRLLTTNGGDTVATLDGWAGPSYAATLTTTNGHTFTVQADRITSITLAEVTA